MKKILSKKIIVIASLFTAVAVMAFQNTPVEEKVLVSEPVATNAWVDEKIASMSLREKIGQFFMVAAYSGKDESHHREIDSLVIKDKVGGIIFFQGNKTNIDRILAVAPEVISHNLETVRRLTREVRIQAKYDRSLEVLKYMKDQGQRRTKSGIMLGLGETEDEVIETMQDLANAKVDILTIGQYLQPSKKHLPVKKFITPDQFDKYKKIGLEMGFRHVESSALVRSSYKAQKHLE